MTTTVKDRITLLGHDLLVVTSDSPDITCRLCPFSDGRPAYASERCMGANEVRSCRHVYYAPVDVFAKLRLQGKL